MSTVSVYVVDLKRTQPFLGGSLLRRMEDNSNMTNPRSDHTLSSTEGPASTVESGSPDPYPVTSSSLIQRGKPALSVRKSFVKEKPGPNGQRPR